MKRFMVGLALVLGFVGGSCLLARARVTKPKSEKRFDRVLRKRRFAVALFYELEKKEKNRIIDETERSFVATSKSRLYREPGVAFMTVNVGREQLSDLDEDFGVTTFPTVLLFNNGVPVRDKSEKIIMLQGAFNRDMLDKFIREHLGKDLKKRMEEIQEERRLRRAASLYYGPSFYWGYPYYGSSYRFYSPYRYRYLRPYGGFGLYW